MITEAKAQYAPIYNNRTPDVLGLPVEVTWMIFTYSRLPAKIEEKGAFKKQSKGEFEKQSKNGTWMEVVVSHVCRQWRSRSLQCPNLWNNFHYEAGPSDPFPLQRFEAYLERSTPLPLSIWLNFNDDCDNPNNLQLVEKAVQNAHRWMHFTMHYPNRLFLEPLDQLHDVFAPMLAYLTVICTFQSDDEYVPDAITSMRPHVFKGGAPKLTYLRLDDTSIRHALPPLSNITILRIEEQWDTVPMFKHTPFLELLSLPSLNQLSLCGDLVEIFKIDRTIHMPNMERFRVSQLHDIWYLLPSIRAPQLKTLIIHECHGNGLNADEWARSALPGGAYTFPTLEKLYVIDSNVEPPIAPAFAHLTSQASEVTISHPELSLSLLQIIIDGGHADAVWPHLAILSCNIEGMTSIDPYLTLANNRPAKPFTLVIHHDLFIHWGQTMHSQLRSLRKISMVITTDNWELNEPFWPQDDDLWPTHDFGHNDWFTMDPYLVFSYFPILIRIRLGI